MCTLLMLTHLFTCHVFGLVLLLVWLMGLLQQELSRQQPQYRSASRMIAECPLHISTEPSSKPQL